MTQAMTSIAYPPGGVHGAAPYGVEASWWQNAGQPINKVGEWYLTVCMFFLLVEGMFNSWLVEALPERAFILFRLTPWNLWPSTMWFYSIGLLIGLSILYGWRRTWHAPTRGLFLYAGMWFVYLGWGIYGAVRHNHSWLHDVRGYALPAIIAPWVATLGKEVRLDVVAQRFIKMAVPGAIMHATLAILYFARGGGVNIAFGTVAPCWESGYVLTFAYLLAFARSIASGKRSTLTLIILGAGITASLDKPTLMTFLFANVALIFFTAQLGRRWKNIRIHNAVIVLAALMTFGVIFGGIMTTVGGGAGKRYVLDRVFKYHLSAHKRDVSGGRMGLWTTAMEDWARHPIIGVGLGKRILVGSRSNLRAVPLHNLYVQTLSQTGLLGFGIVAFVVLVWFFRVSAAIRDEYDERQFWPRLAMHTFVVTLLFACSYGGVFGYPGMAFWLWICVGLEAGAHSQQAMRMQYARMQ